MKKAALIAAFVPLFFLIAGIGTLNFIIVPRVEHWLLQKANSLDKNKYGAHLNISKIKINLLPPSISIENILVEGNTEISKIIPQLNIKSIVAQLDIFKLVTGRLSFAVIVFNDMQLKINMDPLFESRSPPQKLPIEDLFLWAKKIPIQRIHFENTELEAQSVKHHLDIKTPTSQIFIDNLINALSIQIKAPNIFFNKDKQEPIIASLKINSLLNENKLEINQIKSTFGKSAFYAQSTLYNIRNILIDPNLQLDYQAEIDLNDVQNILKLSLSKQKIPQLNGHVIATHQLQLSSGIITGKANVRTEDVFINEFAIGNARISGEYRNNELILSKINLSHPSGEAELIQSQIDASLNFKTELNLHTLDLQKLFLSLDLKQIPVDLLIAGHLNCEGKIRNPFYVDCKGQLSGKDLNVRGEYSPNARTIVAIENFETQGQVSVDSQQVSYQSNIKINKSTGKSDGIISYENGFKINYQTNSLDFSDLKTLSKLNLSGKALIQGSTEGNSRYATLKMNIEPKNFIFENYFLGDFKTSLQYKEGHLLFDDIRGAINATHYGGRLDLNLLESSMSGNILSPTAQLSDVALVFKNIYQWPFDITGKGNVDINFSGPIDFWKLNYKIKSQFINISLGHEIFDQLQFNVSATEGHASLNKVELHKGRSKAIAQGFISSNKTAHIDIVGSDWHLEESDLLNKYLSNVYGNIQFRSQITQSIFHPHIRFESQLSGTVLNELEYADSSFNFEINDKEFLIASQFFGDKVFISSSFSMSEKPGFQIKSKINNFDYSQILSLVSSQTLQNEYKSNLDANINIQSSTGRIDELNGLIQINNVQLSRGSINIKNSAPIDIVFSDGYVKSIDAELTGYQSHILLSGQNFKLSDLNVTLNAETDARILHIFLPFLDDLSGHIELSSAITQSWKKPQILGNLSINNGVFKIRNFPHPFEKIETDINFSHSRILINKIKGQLAGGAFSGDGNILINGINDIPTHIRVHLENPTFNVPDQIKTNGQADLIITGNWFPFTISGSYFVKSGQIEKEFEADQSATIALQKSLYLPRFLKKVEFEPLLFDIQVLIEKTIQINNSIMNGLVAGNLQVKGPVSQPRIVGKLNIEKPSKLKFKDTQFDVQTGLIQFDEQNELNPDIYISSQSRVNQYDIILTIQGRAKSPQIRMVSTPPLSEQELISLLALGFTSSNRDTSAQTPQQQLQTGYNIGASIIGQAVTSKFQSDFDKIGVKLQIGTNYDSTRNISVPKATFSKKITNKWTMSASLQGNEDSEFKLNYRINPVWSVIGSYENKDSSNTSLNTTTKKSSVLGMDLEFKMEFK